MLMKNQLKSGIKKQGEKQISKKNWYLVLIRQNPIHQIKVGAFVKYEFPNYYSISTFLKDNKELLADYFLVPMKGRDLLYYNIPIKKWINLKVIFNLSNLTKYTYPSERNTRQGRKSFRTKSRRQLRDKGRYFNQKFY